MKNSLSLFEITFAAGLAGVAAFAFANSAFVAALPWDVILGVGASLALLGIAAYDYSRRYLPLQVTRRVLHPTLPAASCPDGSECRKDRLAA